MQSLNQNWFYIFSGQADQTRQSSQTQNRLCVSEICQSEKRTLLPYLPYIFRRIKIIIFFTVRTFNLEKNIIFLVSEYL